MVKVSENFELEEWKPVNINNGFYSTFYQVSSFGRVKRLSSKEAGVKGNRKGRVLKQSPVSGGYMAVKLSHLNNKKNVTVHRLVALAHVPKGKGLNVVNHLDHDRKNNHYKNLEWTTTAGNVLHSVNAGRSAIKFFNKEQVISIRRQYREEIITQKQIAINYGCSVTCIVSVLKGRGYYSSYKEDLNYKPNPENVKTRVNCIKGHEHFRSKLTELDVIEIRKMAKLGNMSRKELSEKYNVTYSCISSILSRKTWKHI